MACREAENLKKNINPYIVRFVEAFFDMTGDNFYIVMEKVEGK